MALLLSACGYRLGTVNGELPAGLHALRVPVFVNRTAEPNAEFTFTEAARDQLQRAGTLGGEAADGELQGTLVSVTSGAVATSPSKPGEANLPVYRLSVVLSLTVLKNGVAVSGTTVAFNEEFPSGADVLLTESNRAAALKRVAESAVREGFERLFVPAP